MDKTSAMLANPPSTEKLRIARAALHMWEEPCISGENGSGTIFFTGCTLRCVYCQNYAVSRGKVGQNITIDELAEKMLALQEEKANNINLVTADHFVNPVIKAIELARRQGLTLPVVYNTSSYTPVETIKKLEGIVDVYLPDLKYYSADLSLKYSGAADYFSVASKSIAEMVRQTGSFIFTDEATQKKLYDIDRYQKLYDQENLIMKKGTIVRHLLLPGCLADSKKVIQYLLKTYGDSIFLSLMSQYTPLPHVKELFPELDRRIDPADYEELLDFALDSGLVNGFFQDGDVALESFIPDFGL